MGPVTLAHLGAVGPGSGRVCGGTGVDPMTSATACDQAVLREFAMGVRRATRKARDMEAATEHTCRTSGSLAKATCIAVVGHLAACWMPEAEAKSDLKVFIAEGEIPWASDPQKACGYAPDVESLRAARSSFVSLVIALRRSPVALNLACCMPVRLPRRSVS